MRGFSKYVCEIGIGLAMYCIVAATPAQNFVDYVNPMIGTTGPGRSNYGGTIPAVLRPFGMTHWTAMTRENYMSVAPYNYKDATIEGFLGTHQPAIWMGDYGQVSLMPLTGNLILGAKLPFNHVDELSSPHYYSVRFGEPNAKIDAGIAATERSGFLRFTFPPDKPSHIVVTASRSKKAKGFVCIDVGRREISGYNPDRQSEPFGPTVDNFNGYFVIQFDEPIRAGGTWENEETFPNEYERVGNRVGGYVSFGNSKNKTVNVRIGTSFISVQQAREDLQLEIPDWDIERVKADGKREWNDALGKIKIEGGTKDERTNFYTAMYRSLSLPRLFSEYGRYYSPYDGKVHKGVSYTDFSLWDTFRAEHPLLVLIQPNRVPDMINSLLQSYDESGWLPMWPNPGHTNVMISSHADSVIADAYVKGIRGFDLNKAYEATRKNAMTPPPDDLSGNRWESDRSSFFEARAGLTWYKSLGYVPEDRTAESVSRTLEYAYDDFCVAQLAKAAGKDEDYELLMERSRSYRNLYDPRQMFMRPKLSDGSWDEKTWASTAERRPGFTEGGPWTYLFCAMQDIPGLIELMGGGEKFADRLEENFTGGHYRHNNEPGHHYAYLFNYAGRSWRTQELVREIIAKNYQNRPEGLSGNDDCGQMSAWLVFSAMGFYPVTPGTTKYAIGTPLFDKVTLSLDKPYKRRKFTVIARNNSPENKYIQSATLNGKPLNTPFINHSDIVGGSTMVFVMGSHPNKKWGAYGFQIR